jgi:hypothetical protein
VTDPGYTLVENFYDLVRFARGRLREGHGIENHDDPYHRLLGFDDKTTGEQFRIKLTGMLPSSWKDQPWERIGLNLEAVRSLSGSKWGREILFSRPDLEGQSYEVVMELISQGWG